MTIRRKPTPRPYLTAALRYRFSSVRHKAERRHVARHPAATADEVNRAGIEAIYTALAAEADARTDR